MNCVDRLDFWGGMGRLYGNQSTYDFISTLAIAITRSKESSRVAIEVFSSHDRLHLPSFEQDDMAETDSAGIEF